LAETVSTGEARPSLKITLRVHDYAQVRPRTLAGAKREAGKILRKAGVEVVWLDCYGATVEKNPACSKSLGPTDLVLRIVRSFKVPRAGLRHNTLGIARLPKNGGRGTFASVFNDGLEEVAKAQRLPQRLILGHTLAHEIGHLLFGSTRHSRKGIMRPVLNSNYWHLASMGALLFTPLQAKQLRAEVLARVRQEESVQIGRVTFPE
jgi:hypothetical protein